MNESPWKPMSEIPKGLKSAWFCLKTWDRKTDRFHYWVEMVSDPSPNDVHRSRYRYGGRPIGWKPYNPPEIPSEEELDKLESGNVR